MTSKHSSKSGGAVLYASGPLFAVLSILTVQQAVTTTSQNEALLYAVLGTLFGTLFFGWLIYFGVLLYFRAKDRKK